jgi:hypothetical protein
MTLTELLVLLEQDQELLDKLHELELLSAPLDRDYHTDEAELARVARTLYRELDVNGPGIEVILHMRQQILALQRQMAQLVARLTAEPH